MRTRAAASLVVLLLVAACAGARARDHALWPQVASAWPAVRADCELVLQRDPSSMVSAILDQVDDAVREDDHELLRGLNWSAIALLAAQGVAIRVETGEVSVGVAASLTERNTKFSEAMQELTGR